MPIAAMLLGGRLSRPSVPIVSVPLTIALSQSTLGFQGPQGGPAPAAQAITVSPGGNTPPHLAGPAVGTITDPDDVIDTAVITGTGPTYTLTVTPKVGSLAAGNYSGSVQVTDANAPSATVTVNMEVTSGATITIAGELRRNAGADGSSTAHFACFLQQGQLTSSNLSKFSVWVNDGGWTEKAIYLERPQHRGHSDGSIQVVHGQFVHTVNAASPLPVEFRIGTTRGTTDISKTAITSLGSFPDPHPTRGSAPSSPVHDFGAYGYPNVWALPTSAAHLVLCELVMPCNTAAYDTALGGKSAAYIADFESCVTIFWNQWAATTHNAPTIPDAIYNYTYYDRALSHFAHYVRTGVLEFARKACSYAYGRNMGYYKPATHWDQQEGWAADPYNEFPEGQFLHWMFTGWSTATLSTAKDACYYIPRFWLGSVAWDTELGSQINAYQDPRQMAHALEGIVIAWRAGFDTITKPSGTQYNVATKNTNTLDKMFGVGVAGADPCYQTAGGRIGVWDAGNANACVDKPNPFTFGRLMSALWKYRRWYTADSRINTNLKLALDWHYDQAQTLVGGGSGVAAVSGGGVSGTGDGIRYTFCSSEGTSNPAPVLNGLFLDSWAAVAGAQGGVYNTRADNLRLGSKTLWTSADLPYGSTQKEFNQNYRQSFTYTKDRGL